MLSTQFRMHPAICKLVSSIAYGGQLQTDPGVEAMRVKASGKQAISWITYAMQGPGESKSEGGSPSLKNEQEVKIICDLAITELGVLRPQHKRLLTITFYREQLKVLREELAGIGVLGRDKRRASLSTRTTVTCASRRWTRRKGPRPTSSSSAWCAATQGATSGSSRTRTALSWPSRAPWIGPLSLATKRRSRRKASGAAS